VPIERCLAIEDSPSGIRSANASGARTVAVRRLTPLDPLPGMSRVRSLDSLTDAAIGAIMGGLVLDELGDAV
jgi:beta-phosphoglucomutase-like phosphatase (HAD superfamily)